MRLATRALIAALATLVLCAAVSAQTLRSPNDNRNQSPSVGTGGPEGGPTGLFTIYDGSTIRRGEFTFSIGYSNYDRDPGNVDITDVPLSFNVGLNDHVELFFKTNGYRGIKVNSPTNLSSFYLPNSQLRFGETLLCSGAAIILAPERVSGTTTISGPVFRPAGPPCNVGGQGFVQYPFTGGNGPNFGLTGSAIAPPYVSRLGAPTGGNGNFGAASNFPGVGSVVGGILPGIVLSTTVLDATSLSAGTTVPTVFTINPTYLPDAPFVNRLYGESSFTNFVVGAKIRLTGPHNPFGFALIPFYRWYPDKADDLAGFNQMQRGAGPSGNIGDFGLVVVVDGRLGSKVNLSANGGLIHNSNPKGPGDAVLLDRPDELIAGVGFDFPVSKHFQPIAELRSTQYVGGRTPNSFENSPVDIVGGLKIHPRRWWGVGIAYRRHLNQQDQKHFNAIDFAASIQPVTNVVVPGQGLITIAPRNVSVTSGGFPRGFVFSEDPNGYIGQVWFGRRNARTVPIINQPPTVTASASMSAITRPCPPPQVSESCTATGSEVTLTADARDPDNDTLLYTWSVTGGKLTGEGRSVTWDLSGVANGTYTATVEVNDGNPGHVVRSSATVTVADCARCHEVVKPCPTVSVSCPGDVEVGSPITFAATVNSSDSSVSPTYNWSVSAGTISGGQGTSSITVDTAGLGGQSVTATVDVGGFDPACSRSASCTTSVRNKVQKEPTKFDEYGNIKFNDEKARLDPYASALQGDPGSQGVIIAYGTCEGEGQARADRAKNYLVNTRGIEAGRITTIDGGCRADLTVQLWIVPQGATTPAASTDNIISPCPACKHKRATPRRPRRGRRGDDE